MSRSTRQSPRRRNSHPQVCGSCQDDNTEPSHDIKILRSGRKIELSPSSQEDQEVENENGLQDMGSGSCQDDINTQPSHDKKVLRSGRKIDSVSSFQEDQEVENGLQDMGIDSCQDDINTQPSDDKKVLRSGRKIDSAPSSQEDQEVDNENGLLDMVSGSCQNDIDTQTSDVRKILRSGRKIDSTPSQEGHEVENGLQDMGSGSCQDDIDTQTSDDRKILRSGRKIESAPSSQEDQEVENDNGLQDMFQSLTFIQCENESCLKWRKISQEEAELYQDKSWYCRLNRNDPAHRRCDQPEEDQFVQLAESSGYRYTFSTLQCGALVWARMSGHIQWPAVISRDPHTKEYFWKEGLTESYHVEFLGKRRTHQWISPLYVDPYGNGRKPEFPQDPKVKKKKGKKITLLSRSGTLLRSKAYQRSFKIAVAEAECFQKLTNEKRLQKCIYIPKEKKEVKPVVKVEVDHIVNQMPLVTGPRRTGQRKRYNELTVKTLEERIKIPQLTPVKKRKQSPKQTSSTGRNKEPKCQKKMFKMKKDQCNLSQVLLQEERLFNGAWAHFMKSRELVFDRKLSFNGSSLSAFRLFMSVQERGGYKEMTFPDDWEAIVSELSKKSVADKCQATLLKKLFKRNLLPYEKHLLPGKQDDVNNNVENPPSQREVIPNVAQCGTKPPSTDKCNYPLPAMNVQQMTTPFMGGNVGCAMSGPYTLPYSLNNNSFPQVKKDFKPASSAPPASCSSGAPVMSYYGGSSGTNCGSYQTHWRIPPAGKGAGKTLDKEAEIKRDTSINNNNQNYKQNDFKEPHCPPPVMNSGYNNSRTCTSFSNYGSSGGVISSLNQPDQSWRNLPPVIGRDHPFRQPQFNVPRSQTMSTGWPQPTTSSDFDKDMLEIDSIIQALDKPQHVDSLLQCESFKPAEAVHPAFNLYPMPYDDPVKRIQHKKANYMDDAQCVPDTVIQGNLYTRRTLPVAYTTYPRNLANPTHLGAPSHLGDPSRPVHPPRLVGHVRLDHLTQETSRLDDELQMEFSEL